jgi:predicted glutamine amidotransferase
MCRLLGFVAAHETTPADALADQLPAFTAMSAEHASGWGLAWCEGTDVRTVREPVPALKSEAYRAALRHTATDAGVLHIRLGSPGMAVEPANTHPFLCDGTAFAHNGFVGAPDLIAPRVDKDLLARGGTDSEQYFLAVLTATRRGATPERALLDTARTLLETEGTTSANAMLLTRDALYAVCAFNQGCEPAGRDPDYYALRFRQGADAVVVGSTGVPQPGWTTLAVGHVLTVDRGTLRCEIG